jgi:hypothetical protein
MTRRREVQVLGGNHDPKLLFSLFLMLTHIFKLPGEVCRGLPTRLDMVWLGIDQILIVTRISPFFVDREMINRLVDLFIWKGSEGLLFQFFLC